MLEAIHKSGLPLFLMGVGLSAWVFAFVNPLLLTEGLPGLFFSVMALFALSCVLAMLLGFITGYPQKMNSDPVWGMGIPAAAIIGALFKAGMTEFTQLLLMTYSPVGGTALFLAAILLARRNKDEEKKSSG
ncbi:MAG: hypothetical protein ACOC2C_06075 [Cyclonatronaceae bacterium]